MSVQKKIELSAPAKINLGLKITGKRSDGYHTLQSVFLKVSLYDKICIEYPVREESIQFTGHYSKNISSKNNTIARVLRNFSEEIQPIPNFNITIEKNIPHGSGLGGGSSDAAVVLDYLFQTFAPEVSLTKRIRLAEKIGADVPFFLNGNAAFVEGIGERIVPLPYNFDFHITIFFPRIAIHTSEAFKKFDLNLTQYQKNIIFNPLLKAPVSISEYRKFLANELEDVAMEMVGELRELREKIEHVGFDYIQMTGSGSAFFGLSKKKMQLPREIDFGNVDVFFVEPLRNDGV